MSNNSVTTLKPHISINVRNVEESVEFYTKLFGIEPVKFIKGDAGQHSGVPGRSAAESEKRRFGYAKFDVDAPPLNFVLNEIPYSEGGSLSHLGIQVAATEEVLKTRERWINSGLLTVDEMNVDCCYALQDKTWVSDPDGNKWEVFVVLENTGPRADACACGEKVSHTRPSREAIDEVAGSSAVSASGCCTPGQKASTIGAKGQPCC